MTLLPFRRRVDAKSRLRGGMTAKEGMDILMADPSYAAMMEERLRQMDRNILEFNRAAAGLKAELAQVGFPVEDLGRLWFNFKPEHKVFIPILIKWLPQVDYVEVKETIVRLLTDRMARPIAARPLIEEFRRAPISDEPRILHYKWAIGQALAVVADDSVFNDIAELLRERRHRWSRDMLCIALGRMKNPAATDVLLDVLTEDEGQLQREAAVLMSAVRALGNRKASKAKAHIERFLTHAEPLVRKEAERSLAKIEKAEKKARHKEAQW
ncbi:MAG: HEAT repeat domain-containing protein [Chloroflexi bacterium]|nr:HEAT repeat domain-containing protein [Chloroflexota bacterium]